MEKISQIKDKKTKLKAFIEQKRNAKFKEALEQRSPFIPYVPVGRYVPKKEEPTRRPKNIVISTPVRKALMNQDKILKKPTFKELASTAKKGGMSTSKKLFPTVGSKVDSNLKSRKKILVESNEISTGAGCSTESSDLNTTFEILSESEENAKPKVVKPIKKSAKSKKPAPFKKTISAPAVLKREVQAKKSAPVAKAKIAKLVVRPNPIKKPARPQKEPESILQSTSSEEDQSAPRVVAKTSSEKIIPVVASKSHSHTYKVHKSYHDNQKKYLKMHLDSITDNSEVFTLLPEETQTLLQQSVQYGYKIVNEKLEAFLQTLEKFESSDEKDAKRMTEEDVENYWDLLFEEIDKVKEELDFMRETKKLALKIQSDAKKKRRTNAIEGTPRRSRRIADHAGTPK